MASRQPTIDPFGARATLRSATTATATTGSTPSATGSTWRRAPVTLKILLENVLRHAGGGIVRGEDVETLAAWRPGVAGRGRDPVHAGAGHPPGLHRRPGGRRPRRHARRDGRPRRRPGAGQPARPGRPRHRPLRPGRPVRDAGAFAFNVEREYERNGERYQLLRWAQTAFRDLRVVPPGTGIVHQVNLEFLATVVDGPRGRRRAAVAFPDTLVGPTRTRR